MQQHDTTPFTEENILCAKALWDDKRHRTDDGIAMAHPKPAWDDLTFNRRKILTEDVGFIRTWFEDQDARDAENWRQSQAALEHFRPLVEWNDAIDRSPVPPSLMEDVSEQVTWQPNGSEPDCTHWDADVESLEAVDALEAEIKLLQDFDRGYHIGEHFIPNHGGST